MVDANSSNHSNATKNSMVNEDFQVENNGEEDRNFIISIDFLSKSPYLNRLLKI